MRLAVECCEAVTTDKQTIYGVCFADWVKVMCRRHFECEKNDLKFRSLGEALQHLASTMLRTSDFISEAREAQVFVQLHGDQTSLFLLLQPDCDYSTPLGKVIFEYLSQHGNMTASLGSQDESFAFESVLPANSSFDILFEDEDYWQLYAKRLITLITLGGLAYLVRRDHKTAAQMKVDEGVYPLPLTQPHNPNVTVSEVVRHKMTVPVWYSNYS